MCFCLLKNIREETNKLYFDKNKIISLSKSSLKPKNYSTCFLYICTEGGHFPSIIAIALFSLLLFKLKFATSHFKVPFWFASKSPDYSLTIHKLYALFSENCLGNHAKKTNEYKIYQIMREWQRKNECHYILSFLFSLCFFKCMCPYNFK